LPVLRDLVYSLALDRLKQFSAGTLAKLRLSVGEQSREPPPLMTAERASRVSGSKLCTSKSARGKNAYGLLYKLSKKTRLGIKCLDMFHEGSSHRLHSVENLVCSILDR
jgi:hypothetical protein